MRHVTAQSFMPIAITAITSLLFLGTYDSAYAISMLTGLTFFFYFAECVRQTAQALTTRKIHHYAIPLSVLRMYAPSIIAIIIIIRVTRAPLTPTQFLMGSSLPAANAIMLWGFIWGASRLITRRCLPYDLTGAGAIK